jgi:glycosyltransferase involved in cell wall biosynthesis
MTICFFGAYRPEYSRNWILRTGFERLGHTVLDCRSTTRSHWVPLYLWMYFELLQEYRKIRRTPVDLVIVCFPGQRFVWLARLLFGYKKLVWDAFLSLYDTNVYERKYYGAWNVRAWRDWLLDWSSSLLARASLLECSAYADYFARTFHVPRRKFIRAWVGANDVVFKLMPAEEPEIFTVHFHGSFLLLQGVRYILEAAELLKSEEIIFQIIGDDVEEGPKMRALATKIGLPNVRFLGARPNADIPDFLARSHVSLGVFGDSDKTQHIIANKVYEAFAVGRPVITADTPAMRELTPEGEEAYLVPVADPRALADAIMKLRDNPAERERLARGGKELFDRKLHPEMIVAELIENLKMHGFRELGQFAKD